MMKIRRIDFIQTAVQLLRNDSTALWTQEESCYPENHILTRVYVCAAKFSISYCRWFFTLFIQNKTSCPIDPRVFSSLSLTQNILDNIWTSAPYKIGKHQDCLPYLNFIWASRCYFCAIAKTATFSKLTNLLDPTVYRRTRTEVASASILLYYNSKQRLTC